MQNFFHS